MMAGAGARGERPAIRSYPRQHVWRDNELIRSLCDKFGFRIEHRPDTPHDRAVLRLEAETRA
jgi:hypothetical protein